MKAVSFLFLVLVASLMNCQPKPDIGSLVKDMRVETDYDPSAPFSSYQTYSLVLDTIGYISNFSNANAIVGQYAKDVTSNIKLEMDLAGYTRVDSTQGPELGLRATVVRNYQVYQSYSYYSPYYYGYYGGYGYPYVTTSVSDEATLVIEMLDLKNLSNGKAKLIWIAYIGDLITTSDPLNSNPALIRAVKKAFTQSPYIKKGP